MADRLKRALIVRRFAVEYTLLYGLPVHCYDTVPTAANAISQSPTSSFLLAPRDSRICFPAYYITTPTISFSPSQNCSLSLSLSPPLSLLSLSLARSLAPECRPGHHVREPRATRVTNVTSSSRRWWTAASCERRAQCEPTIWPIIVADEKIARSFRN